MYYININNNSNINIKITENSIHSIDNNRQVL